MYIRKLLALAVYHAIIIPLSKIRSWICICSRWSIHTYIRPTWVDLLNLDVCLISYGLISALTTTTKDLRIVHSDSLCAVKYTNKMRLQFIQYYTFSLHMPNVSSCSCFIRWRGKTPWTPNWGKNFTKKTSWIHVVTLMTRRRIVKLWKKICFQASFAHEWVTKNGVKA